MNGIVSKLYVEYTDDGTVTRIVNQLDPTVRSFEMDIELIVDLYGNQHNLSKYNIEYFFNLAKGIVEEIEEEVQIKNNVPYVIPRTANFDNEVTLEHDPSIDGWTMYFRDDVIDKLNVIDNITFYICKKDDPHYLHGSIQLVDISDGVVDGKLQFGFAYTIEENLNDFCLVVIPNIFKSYGVKDKNESKV
jgi:hypothetical protein